MAATSSTAIRDISVVAKSLGLKPDEWQSYGRDAAKITIPALRERTTSETQRGRLIAVTAITPTTAGEGKTTVSIGLSQALHRAAQNQTGRGRTGRSRAGQNVVAALREPSLGPVFGMKGGATGGGAASLHPSDEINLHFTGDLHAITSANNLLAAALDNHLQSGNVLGIEPRTIVFRRCLDMNDRALRYAVIGLGGRINGVPRESQFEITAASEVMATLALASDIADLKARLTRIVVGRNTAGEAVTAGDLKVVGAMAALLRDALRPNLVQTVEGNPALVHLGPFGNIAHGCNSVLATRLALSLGDLVVTEAGFGSDLGFEKFCNIKMRAAGLQPHLVVLVATLRALKLHGEVHKSVLATPNARAVGRGLVNLERHAGIIASFGLPFVVAINSFPSDTDEEREVVQSFCAERGWSVAVCDVFAQGGAGGEELAARVLESLPAEPPPFAPTYALEEPLEEKIAAVARAIYGASGVEFASAARQSLEWLHAHGYGGLPICMAKTQYSLSDDAALGTTPPVGSFSIRVRDLKVSAGAGFVVAYAGEISTMPGLPKVPAAERMDLSDDGEIIGVH